MSFVQREPQRSDHRHAFMWLLMGFLASGLFGQNNTGELRLSVKDASGSAVSATAKLVSEASKTQQSFELPANGKYAFKNLPFGRYVLSVSKAGFSPFSELV